MFENPFTPTFGGKPDFFFGRKNIIARFEKALVNRGSADRVLFITGNRGCGKTALLEQLSLRARNAGWKTVDINSEHALGALLRSLVRHASSTKRIAPEVSVNVFGSGASLAGLATEATTTFEEADIGIVFQEACAKEKQGLFVSIDEVQKINLDELSSICGAFQMASRKGFDVMLAVAGLPYAYNAIVQHEGCTYMRRSVHEQLSVFTHREATDAFREAFARIKGLSIEDEALAHLVRASFGHPYFIQLAGYNLVERANKMAGGKRYKLTTQDTESVLPDVVEAYEQRSLAPIVDAVSNAERAYLVAMATVINEDRVATSADIAKALGKTTQQASPTRQKLLREGIIVSISRGKMMFNIPYLREYLLKEEQPNPEPILAQEWKF